jgi:hypothetical protein
MVTKKTSTFTGYPRGSEPGFPGHPKGTIQQPIPRRPVVRQPGRLGHSSTGLNTLPSAQVQRSGPIKRPLPPRPTRHVERGTND